MGNCGSDFSLCNVRDPDVNEDTSIQNLKNWKVRIQSSNDRGVGVFALKRIEAGEVCFGYWGDEGFPVAKWKLHSSGLTKSQLQALEDLYYSTNAVQIIPSSTPVGLLFASALNHSSQAANVTYNGVKYMAKKRIDEGEELLIDYSVLCTSFNGTPGNAMLKYEKPDVYFNAALIRTDLSP